MKKLSILMAILLAMACSKDDDDNQSQDPPAGDSSFTLASDDGALDLSGEASLLPHFGVDSIITVQMTTEDNYLATLALYSEGGAWESDHFSLTKDSVDEFTYFALTITNSTSSEQYASIRGDVHITAKEEGEFIDGNLDVLLLNTATQDTAEVSGSFHAVQDF